MTINQLSFGTESILANVSGLTVVAETLIAEEFETLWRAAGAIKSWSSKEVQESVQLESFGTHTKVDIGFDPLLLLDSKVRGYLQSAMRSIGPAMTSRSIYDKFAPPSNI